MPLSPEQRSALLGALQRVEHAEGDAQLRRVWEQLGLFVLGVADDTSTPIIASFDAATPSPLALGPLPVGGLVVRCSLQVTEAFDDPAATVSIGTGDDPTAILSEGIRDLATLGQSNIFDLYSSEVPEVLMLWLNPAASTTGSGRVYLQIRR